MVRIGGRLKNVSGEEKEGGVIPEKVTLSLGGMADTSMESIHA